MLHVGVRGGCLVCAGMDLLNLPRSVGELYGVLFIAENPMCLDDLRIKLNISKGSTSQGLGEDFTFVRSDSGDICTGRSKRFLCSGEFVA